MYQKKWALRGARAERMGISRQRRIADKKERGRVGLFCKSLVLAEFVAIRTLYEPVRLMGDDIQGWQDDILSTSHANNFRSLCARVEGISRWAP